MENCEMIKRGSKVRLRRDAERFDNFIACRGLTGVVEHIGNDDQIVKMDLPLIGAEDWDNCVVWHDYAEFCDDCELIPTCAEDVLNDAESAFWETVAKAFPDVKTGDFPPHVTFQLRVMMESAINLWLRLNRETEDRPPYDRTSSGWFSR